jgi:hypothetical protein
VTDAGEQITTQRQTEKKYSQYGADGKNIEPNTSAAWRIQAIS